MPIQQSYLHIYVKHLGRHLLMTLKHQQSLSISDFEPKPKQKYMITRPCNRVEASLKERLKAGLNLTKSLKLEENHVHTIIFTVHVEFAELQYQMKWSYHIIKLHNI